MRNRAIRSRPNHTRACGSEHDNKARIWTVCAAIVALAAAGCSGGDAPRDASSLVGAVDNSAALALADPPDVAVGPAAPTAEDAVNRFVVAEAAGDYSVSFELLDLEGRRAARGRAGWIQSNFYRPQLRSFTISELRAVDEVSVEVVGEGEFVTRLDEVVGLVSARGRVSWRAVAEDGGWRVAYLSSVIRGMYPDDDTADDAAHDWVAARQRCADEAARALEYQNGLLGAAGLASTLCDKPGVISVGAVKRLGERPNPAPVIAAFGAEADLWARIVRVDKPVALNVVLAPLGERWIVIGLLA